MGTLPIEHHSGESARLIRPGPIVAFDFDGTLTVKDTFLAFLRWRKGDLRYAIGLARLGPASIAYLIHRNRERLKASAVRVFLKGLPLPVLEAEAREFAVAAAPLLFRPDALKVWRRHRDQGAVMVIVTASPEAVIAPFARGLGADYILGTPLAVGQTGRLTGALGGPNCRGPEKVNRLRAVFGDDVRLKAAYGDTRGDDEMLQIAEEKGMRLFVGDPAKGPDLV